MLKDAIIGLLRIPSKSTRIGSLGNGQRVNIFFQGRFKASWRVSRRFSGSEFFVEG